MRILSGRKVILFPFSEKDQDYFIKLLQHEGQLMGQEFFKTSESYLAYVIEQILSQKWVVWTVWTKNGKASTKIGFIIIFNISANSVEIQGLMDKFVLKGLLELLKREDKYTFSEDAVRVVLNHCFVDIGINRVCCESFSSNRVARKLIEKVGFVKEGKLRSAGTCGRKLDDIVLYSMLKSEFKEPQNDRRPEIERGAESNGLVPPKLLESVR